MENLLKRQNELEKRNKELEACVMSMSKNIMLNVSILNEHTEILANHDATHANLINHSQEIAKKMILHDEAFNHICKKMDTNSSRTLIQTKLNNLSKLLTHVVDTQDDSEDDLEDEN